MVDAFFIYNCLQLYYKQFIMVMIVDVVDK